MRRGIECDALRLHTGPLHPAVERFVCYYERSGIFDELGDPDDFVGANEAAHWLDRMFAALARLFALAERVPCACDRSDELHVRGAGCAPWLEP